MAEEIANNNLALPDIEVNSMDEVGQALVALNRMKNNLTAVVGTIGGDGNTTGQCQRGNFGHRRTHR